MVEADASLAPRHHDDSGAVERLRAGGAEDVRLAELRVRVGEYRAYLAADRRRCRCRSGLAGRCRRGGGRWWLLRLGRRGSRLSRLGRRLRGRDPVLLLLLALEVVLLFLQGRDLRLDPRLAGGEVGLLRGLPGGQAVEAGLLILKSSPRRRQRRDIAVLVT